MGHKQQEFQLRRFDSFESKSLNFRNTFFKCYLVNTIQNEAIFRWAYHSKSKDNKGKWKLPFSLEILWKYSRIVYLCIWLKVIKYLWNSPVLLPGHTSLRNCKKITGHGTNFWVIIDFLLKYYGKVNKRVHYDFFFTLKIIKYFWNSPVLLPRHISLRKYEKNYGSPCKIIT